MPIPYLRFSRAEIERLIHAFRLVEWVNIDIIIIILDGKII